MSQFEVLADELGELETNYAYMMQQLRDTERSLAFNQAYHVEELDRQKEELARGCWLPPTAPREMVRAARPLAATSPRAGDQS